MRRLIRGSTTRPQTRNPLRKIPLERKALAMMKDNVAVIQFPCAQCSIPITLETVSTGTRVLQVALTLV